MVARTKSFLTSPPVIAISENGKNFFEFSNREEYGCGARFGRLREMPGLWGPGVIRLVELGNRARAVDVAVAGAVPGKTG